MMRETCAACGHLPTLLDPLVRVAADPLAGTAEWLIHRSHVLDPGSGFHGSAYQEAAA